jgi:hypothetical protein
MKPKPVPTLEEMYAFLAAQIKATRDRNRQDILLDQWLKLPEMREWLVKVGARGA